MHVATRPIKDPVTLVEHFYTTTSGRECLRVLVFREGILARPVVGLLNKLLSHI